MQKKLDRITKGVVFLVTSVTTDSTNFVRKAKNLNWSDWLSLN